MSKTKEYKAVSNYLLNTLEFTKELAQTVIENKIEKMLSNKIEDKLKSNWFDSLLQITLLKIMNRDVEKRFSPYSSSSFEELIENEIKKTVKKFIEDTYSIDVSISLNKKEQ